jgi:hypothetical protein
LILWYSLSNSYSKVNYAFLGRPPMLIE